MTISATELRSKLYQVLHGISATGQPVEVELKGERFLISPAGPAQIRRLADLPAHPDAVAGSVDDLDEFSPWDQQAWEQAQR